MWCALTVFPLNVQHAMPSKLLNYIPKGFGGVGSMGVPGGETECQDI